MVGAGIESAIDAEAVRARRSAGKWKLERGGRTADADIGLLREADKRMLVVAEMIRGGSG